MLRYRPPPCPHARNGHERPSPRLGSYYATTASYLGPAYLRLAFSAYLRGEVDLAELADHLGVKARSVAGLEPYLEATG